MFKVRGPKFRVLFQVYLAWSEPSVLRSGLDGQTDAGDFALRAAAAGLLAAREVCRRIPRNGSATEDGKGQIVNGKRTFCDRTGNLAQTDSVRAIAVQEP